MKTKNPPVKKKKIAFKILIITIALVVFLGCGFLLFNFLKEDKITIAKTAIDKALNTVSTEIEDINSMPQYLSDMKEKCKYEVLSAREEDDMIIASISVSSPNLYDIVKNLDSSYLDYPDTEDMDKILSEEIKNAKTITTELEVTLLKTADGYEALLTDEFANAYYGGILQLRQEYIDSLWEGLDR